MPFAKWNRRSVPTMTTGTGYAKGSAGERFHLRSSALIRRLRFVPIARTNLAKYGATICGLHTPKLAIDTGRPYRRRAPHVLFISSAHATILVMIERFKDVKFIFLIGIGGSNLATKAVWNALTLHKATSKKFFFLEAPDSREYEEVQNILKDEIKDPKDFVIIATSKSGKTKETLETFKTTFEYFKNKFGEEAGERTIVISSPSTPLWDRAEVEGIERVEWENNVGGRFSAFTVAHTLPLQIAGLNIDKYLEGKKEIEDNKKEAEKLAQTLFESHKNGVEIFDLFLFNTELEDVGKWVRQLIAESLGLLTPTVSIGPTDLHSQLELTLGGPKNRFTLFVRSRKEIEGSLNEESYKSVTEAYATAGLPFEKFEMEEINEREIGKFFEYMMILTIEFARLADIDPYGQPAVEEYKKHATENN